MSKASAASILFQVSNPVGPVLCANVMDAMAIAAGGVAFCGRHSSMVQLNWGDDKLIIRVQLKVPDTSTKRIDSSLPKESLEMERLECHLKEIQIKYV